MVHEDVIGPLFENILHNDIRYFGVNVDDIRNGIQDMKEVYLPNPSSLSSNVLDIADYNNVAHRCAYLHKYAPIHTALITDMLTKALEHDNFSRILAKFYENSGVISVCSIGGGPGTDIIGIILVLVSKFGFFQMSSTIIDIMDKWSDTFSSVIRELQEVDYGLLSEFVQQQYLEWNYIEHNLLDKMSNEVNKAVQGAHIITMVKFISAAACTDTSEMVKKIFRSLKPGALVLYIDNAGGGFHQTVQRCAQECRLFTLFGPLKHEHYRNENFNVKKFGYTPCLETTITFHIWRKSDNSSYTGGEPRIQGSYFLNTSTNQYNVNNTNIFYTNTSNTNFSANRRNASQNPTLGKRGNNRQQNRRFVQPQPQIMLPDSNDSDDDLREYNENEFNCCVIL